MFFFLGGSKIYLPQNSLSSVLVEAPKNQESLVKKGMDVSTHCQTNIAMENGPFEDVFPLVKRDGCFYIYFLIDRYGSLTYIH